MIFLHLNSLINTGCNICKYYVHQFLQGVWYKSGGAQGLEWNRNGDKGETFENLIKIAKLLAHLRGVIEIWSSKSEQGTDLYEYKTLLDHYAHCNSPPRYTSTCPKGL